jgi:hypothetical protein
MQIQAIKLGWKTQPASSNLLTLVGKINARERSQGVTADGSGTPS